MTDVAKDSLEQAISRNRDALLRIVAVLFLYAGLDEGGADTIPRRFYRRILRILRPAEAAVRRLIVAAARDLSVEIRARRAKERKPTAIEQLQAKGMLVIVGQFNLGLARAPQPQAPAATREAAPSIPAFPLSDPPRRFDARGWNGDRPFPKGGFAATDPDEEIDAARLCLRLQALKRALDDIPGQAQRLARRKAMDALKNASPQPRRRFVPLRPGWPPGRRKRPAHEIDEVLAECHSLAIHARSPPDTS